MIALARKYRPRRFSDLLVQDHVAASLSGAVAKGRVGHGYLLAGPRGTGKTTAARILAMALNCERRGTVGAGEPCGECPSCQRVWSGAANLDVVEIDAASNRGVDDARDLRERAMYAASQEGRHKVYIVDEAHMLTREAWNALLKILEEPPPGVVFVFATTEPQKIAAAAAPVLSRLQRFDFRRIGPAAIRERLRQVIAQEGLAAEDDALVLIARYADGGMRDALSVLDQCLSFGESPITAATVRRVLGLIDDDRYAALLRAVAARDAAAIFPLVDELVESGADLVEFMTGAADLLRSLLITLSGAEPAGITETLRQAIAECRERLAPSDAVRMLALLAEAETAIRRSGSARIIVETLLLRWTLMDRVVELERVIAGGALGGAGPVAAPPARAASAARKPDPPTTPAPRQPAGPRDLSLDTLRRDWPELVAAARARSNVLGEALARMAPAAVTAGEIRLTAPAADAMFVEGLQRRLADVDELMSLHYGSKTRVLVAVEALPSVEVDRPKRLSGDDLRTERLGRLRGLDPALDTLANELDLEIVDDSPRSP